MATSSFNPDIFSGPSPKDPEHHSNGSDIQLNLDGEDAGYIESNNEDNGRTTEATQAAPPALVRRMSSAFIDRMDTSGVGGFIPSALASHIPGMGTTSHKNVLKATYFCNICFSHYPIDEGFALRTCQHQFCTECLKGFVQNAIVNGNIYLNCFHPMGDDERPCSQEIDEEDIHQLVDADIWDKYNKFKINKENNLSRQCPYCDHTQIGSTDTTRMICENTECGKCYCLKHANAHPMDEDCEAYELRMRKEDHMNEMAAQEMDDGCKPCPKCEFRIVKSGGCNHMKCVKCGCSFCWLCLEEIEDVGVPNHYKDPDSPCHDKQFEGMDDGETPPICAMIVVGCLMCIFCIPGTALGLVGAVLCYPMVCCCMYVAEGDILNFLQFWGGCAMGCIILPTFLLMLVVVMFWMFLTGLYNIAAIFLPCLPVLPPRCERWWEPSEIEE